MTPEDAWCEEAYDLMVKEILESHREEAIAEIVSERMASCYRNNPDLASAAESAQAESRSLLSFSPTAPLVLFRSASGIALRDVLLQPIAHGMVHHEHGGALPVERAIRSQQFKKLLFGVPEAYGKGLKTAWRNGASSNTCAEIQEIANVCCQIPHHGETTATKEQVGRFLEFAEMLLEEFDPYLRIRVVET